MQLSTSLVKNSLASHSWLGLMIAALMYAVCLSGTLLVFHPELEQWEQPWAPVTASADIATLEQSFNNFVDTGVGLTPHLYLVLPTKGSPFARIATEDKSWFLNSDGSDGPVERIPFSTMLLDLHLFLHLPKSWGMILVSASGAVLIAMIISGFLAHPGLFRDAFSLRHGGTKQLEQTDLHNRLSVWGAPFYLMIAVTGAYFGLALPNLAVLAEAEYDGDPAKVIELVYGTEPTLNQPVGRIEIARAMATLAELAPNAEPLMLVLHDAGTDHQHMSISAFHPGRMIYSENYLFAPDGTFLRTEGWLDAPIGKQAIYGIYRLHFGNFAGLLVKVAYFVLGLALSVVSVTGVNIWLAKRRRQDALGDIWVGFVWGFPLGIACAAFLGFLTDFSSTTVMWLVTLISCVAAGFLRNPTVSRRLLQFCLIIALVATVITQVLGSRGFDTMDVGRAINLATAVSALLILFLVLGKSSTKHVD